MKYFGFDGRDDVLKQFEAGTNNGKGRWDDDYKFIPDPNFPTDEEILFASYGGGPYEGDAHVIYEKDGKLYEAHGSHCSCYGLEGQWSPEETSWEAINLRPRNQEDSYSNFLNDHGDDAREALWKLVDFRLGKIEDDGSEENQED